MLQGYWDSLLPLHPIRWAFLSPLWGIVASGTTPGSDRSARHPPYPRGATRLYLRGPTRVPAGQSPSLPEKMVVFLWVSRPAQNLIFLLELRGLPKSWRLSMVRSGFSLAAKIPCLPGTFSAPIFSLFCIAAFHVKPD